MSVEDPFVRIEREKPLSYKVGEQIRKALRQKVFLPGEKLPGEIELAEKFGVSRTAIREALRLLSGRGLVDIRKGSGVYVSEIDMSYVVDPFYDLLEMKCGEGSLLHIIRVRLFMEPPITRIAVEHHSEDDITYLQNQFKKMEEHIDDPAKNIEYDINFHRRIASATNNPLIPVIMEPIFQLLDKFISLTYKQSHAPEMAINFHRTLVECFQNQDSERAYEVMKEHMTTAEVHTIQYYKSINFEGFIE